jgi:hypothetical protein
MLDWAAPSGIGFSHVVSLGDVADVDFGDMLDYLAADGHTRAILLYAEGITHGRKFMSAARAAARAKPVLVLRAGHSAAGAKAAHLHAGALAGSDAVYDAAFARAGMLRVGNMAELFAASSGRPDASRRSNSEDYQLYRRRFGALLSVFGKRPARRPARRRAAGVQHQSVERAAARWESNGERGGT